MIFYITVIRALAAMIITNSHYGIVYPNDIFANGGLLGDVMFFAVSGFCLINIQQNFSDWYFKRIKRIYPSIWIITVIYIVFGFYKLGEWSFFDYFVYPTYYHFIASIVVLYIPFYFVVKSKKLINNIPKVIFTLSVIQLVIYLFWYDKSIYHIDVVREPMIRFLFFYSMLLGAYFRVNKEKYLNKNKVINWLILILLAIAYFISKIAFAKIPAISSYQIINQLILIILLNYILKCFASINAKLEMLPNKIKKSIVFIANITLEIYLVQYVIIRKLAFVTFPLNLFIITFLIIVTAFILNRVTAKVVSSVGKLSNKFI